VAALDRSPERLAGPPRLGRSLLIGPGQEIPAPWRNAPVVEASAAAEPSIVERLHQAWRERRAVVIEWTGSLPPADSSLDTDFHDLTPTSEPPGERLHFAITANAVNLLGERPSFDPITLALAAGAELGSTGDVVLPDGTSAWTDGGPLDRFDTSDLDGVPLVPRAHLVAGWAVAEQPDPPSPAAELAPDQLAAVGHRGGPARIIAPAGSGKTRVLTERTRHLVRDRGLRAEVVSLVAYNRRARQEMSDRLDDVPGLDIRTLNSLALAIATGSGPFATAGPRGGLTTISELDARRLLDKVVPGRRRRQLTDPLEVWIDALSACRLGLRSPEEIESIYGGDVASFGDVLRSYRAELHRRGELDFDEQILTAIEVLLTDPRARDRARRAAPILLIDEFQDLTPAHLLLVRLLAGPAGEVFAVGDDDQTIYGYSGARPEWLVDFSRFFAGAEDHPLTVNYRCPPEVIVSASNLLSYNRNRVPKSINPDPNRAPSPTDDGAETRPLLINVDDEPQQRLVDHVSALLATGSEPTDIAVLARVNAALLPATIYLAEAGVPVAKPAGVDVHLLERSGLRAALSWLRLATAPEQRLRADDLRMALRRPPRSIHPRITDWVCEQRSVKHLLALSGRLNKEREAQLVAEFASDIELLRGRADAGASAVELLDDVYDRVGLLGAASQLDQSQRTARRAAHADELAALRALAVLHPEANDLESWLRDRLDQLPRFDDDDRGDAVTLATIHTTKGLEWLHVVVHDVRGDLHPHRLAADTEEERRIFHVAITRCRRSVLVNAHPTAAGPPTSPFVGELDRPRPDDQPWPALGPSEGRRSTRNRSTGDTRASSKPMRQAPSSPGAAVRRQSLAEWRAERCRQDGVPAYIVIDNATLDAIAEAAPSSLIALGRIKGIGPTKLERYGADILGVVADTE